MSKTKTTFYRPELDVVRFLAFLCVFFHHTIPRGTGRYGSAYDAIVDSFGFGLSLFFTLSAYLITLLLLKETRDTGSIHLRAFYYRRMLRIWPLYFFGLFINSVVAILTVHLHTTALLHALLLGLIMCGNLVPPLLNAGHPVIGALWSISVEEQFYVFWPTLMGRASRRGVIAAASALVLIANLTLLHLGQIHLEVDVGVWSNSFVEFEFFGFGILLAIFDTRRPVFKLPGRILILSFASLLWFTAAFQFGIKGHPVIPPGPTSLCAGYLLVAVSCVLIIIAFSGLTKAPKPFIYLGKRSFGLYVYHAPVLLLLNHFVASRFPHAITVSCLIITVACSIVSYQYLERPFLRWKRSFELVHGRPL